MAKVIARSGYCSRRDAEGLIEAQRVKVNGTVIVSAALDVSASDVILVDGQALPPREPPRLWKFYKPKGRVTTHKDPEGRPTVFDALPEGLPRLISVGRLDFNTEGLLLLTNDGDLARHLELPSTGWARRYRVRAHGAIEQASLDALAQGVTVGKVNYGPVEASVEREQGGNVWIALSIREGKNREVRRIMEHLGLVVTRLIRVSFGPFMLGDLQPGQIEEVKTAILKDQLGPRLSRQLGVRRAPVREERRLEPKRGKGTYLRRKPQQQEPERPNRTAPEMRVRRVFDIEGGEARVETRPERQRKPFGERGRFSDQKGREAGHGFRQSESAEQAQVRRPTHPGSDVLPNHRTDTRTPRRSFKQAEGHDAEIARPPFRDRGPKRERFLPRPPEVRARDDRTGDGTRLRARPPEAGQDPAERKSGGFRTREGGFRSSRDARENNFHQRRTPRPRNEAGDLPAGAEAPNGGENKRPGRSARPDGSEHRPKFRTRSAHAPGNNRGADFAAREGERERPGSAPRAGGRPPGRRPHSELDETRRRHPRQANLRGHGAGDKADRAQSFRSRDHSDTTGASPEGRSERERHGFAPSAGGRPPGRRPHSELDETRRRHPRQANLRAHGADDKADRAQSFRPRDHSDTTGASPVGRSERERGKPFPSKLRAPRSGSRPEGGPRKFPGNGRGRKPS